jgi:hypothetical protein
MKSVKHCADTAKPGEWFCNGGGAGMAFLNTNSNEPCPGVVQDVDTGKWFVWPMGKSHCRGKHNYDPEIHGPLYPTRRAAMMACLLIYSGDIKR